VAAGLGITTAVTSPTFTIVNEYPTTPPLLHIDLYRIGSSEEFAMLGIAERFASSIALIEWPEHAEDELEDAAFSVHIRIVDENTREITIEPDPGTIR
jgi:tRNA threonylcarbamoyladenosine biosynthesis protein TsaE